MASVQSDMNILSMLNDDCIYEILDWLSLDDLCLFSRTCKRLQGLCDNHFRRKFPNKASEVAILVHYNGKLRCEQYVNYFNNFIKTLSICCVKKDFDQYHLLNFIKAKCDPNLREIIINGKLASFGTEIVSFFRSVEIVQFSHSTIYGQDESTFLKNFPNLTTISFIHSEFEERAAEILAQKYPKLKIFNFKSFRRDRFVANKLETFLQQHDEIQCMEWRLRPYPCWSINNQLKDQNRLLKSIKTIVDFALNLRDLFLDVEHVLVSGFEQLCGYLKILCDRDTFKSLHLEVYYNIEAVASHQHQLANLKQLTKISMSGNEFYRSLSVLRPFIHLKSIHLAFLHGDWDWDWSTLDELLLQVNNNPIIALPQIEELTIESGGGKTLLTVLMQLARHWMNLKKISVGGGFYSQCLKSFYVAGLNRARLKLENACELTIFFGSYYNTPSNMDHKLVKYKVVASIHQCYSWCEKECELESFKRKMTFHHCDSMCKDECFLEPIKANVLKIYAP